MESPNRTIAGSGLVRTQAPKLTAAESTMMAIPPASVSAIVTPLTSRRRCPGLTALPGAADPLLLPAVM